MKNITAELPYERFLEKGPAALTETELLAIILRTGTKDCSALELAQKVFQLGSYPKEGLLALYNVSIEELTSISGIGIVKAIKLKAIAELSMRMQKQYAKNGFCATKPESVADYFMESMRHLTYERVVMASLDSKGLILKETILSEGTVNSSLLSSRSVFMEALSSHAVSIILLHNHPSGDPAPSQKDIEITIQIKNAGILLDIPLLDHIIIGDNTYYSLREGGYL